MQKKCDIVIPIYNSPDWVELCIEAVKKSDLSGVINNIILVNDCSNEETEKLLQSINKANDNVILINNEVNSGFVKTCNKGMKQSTADYIMLLNSDCLLAEDSTKKMMDILDKDKEIGLICPLSNNAANISLDIPKGLNYAQFDKVLEQCFKGMYFDACTIVGNCMIITRECYNKVGGLDEAFGFGYGEETDYQFKSMEKGFKAVVSIDTFVFHKSQMSFGNSEELNERKLKNRDLFFSRWEEEYNKCMALYEKNDPVKYVIRNIDSGIYDEFEKIDTALTKNFLVRVSEIDKKYNKVTSADIEINKNASNSKLEKAFKVYKKSGVKGVIKKVIKYLLKKKNIEIKRIGFEAEEKFLNYKDYLIVISSEEDIDSRKVNELSSKLEVNGSSCDIICCNRINIEFIKYYRGFIFIDCNYSQSIQVFAQKSKKLNKSIFILSKQMDIINSWEINDVNGIISSSASIVDELKDKGYNVFFDKSCMLLEEEERFKEDNILDSFDNTILGNGIKLKRFLDMNMNKNVMIIVPHTGVCGGVNIAIRHGNVLQHQGLDVTILSESIDETSRYLNGNEIPVLLYNKTNMLGSIDKSISTMWTTIYTSKSIFNIKERYYLVQGFETGFYTSEELESRIKANSTYFMDDIKYVTVSKWCKQWLEEEYNRKTRFIRDGISIKDFAVKERKFNNKITILVEGNSEAFKKVDESFKIINKLDKEKFEIIYLSTYSDPKEWYRVDKFYKGVDYSEVPKVYQQADILIKSSILESFSYPPLEMLATGGIVLAVQNDGNKEYLVNNYNCLIYDSGNIDQAVEKIYEIVENSKLRNKLISNGIKTATERDWSFIEQEIIEAYK